MSANPVELTREDVERILALADARLVAAKEAPEVWEEACDALEGAMDMHTLKKLCQAALRGMESQGVTMILPDVIGILPMLKGLATLGDFDDLNYDGRPINDELASAIGTLTELEELCARAQPRGEKP